MIWIALFIVGVGLLALALAIAIGQSLSQYWRDVYVDRMGARLRAEALEKQILATKLEPEVEALIAQAKRRAQLVGPLGPPPSMN